jgi:hypothetical protein
MELKEELLEQLRDACHELEEFGEARAVSVDENTKEVLIAFRYDDPENTGKNTIFCNY